MLDERYRNLREMLIRHEGLRLFPYRDTMGKLTIGVGRCLDTVGISKLEAMALLTGDIERSTEAAATFAWFKSISVPRQDVVISMLFSLGLGGFMKFAKMRTAIAIGDFNKAADEMLNSTWSAQTGPRASELARIMRSGAY